MSSLLKILFHGCLFFTLWCHSAELKAPSENPQNALLSNWEQISNRWSSLSFQKAKEAAQMGEPAAEYFVGRCNVDGIGMDKNGQEGLRLIKRAAEKGLAEAQNRMGWMCANGLVTKKDLSEAFEWYRRAAEQGYAKGQFNVGLNFE